MKTPLLYKCSSLAFLPILASAACGSPPSEEPSPGQPNGSAPLVAGATGSAEKARIQRFLDDRYLASDVKYSFETELGQTIDCIDFYAQPSVKALMAQGIEPATTAPPLPANLYRSVLRDRSAIEVGATADENGRLRACPDGMVAQIHFDADAIMRTGGLDTLVSKISHKLPPPSGTPAPLCPETPDYPSYAHAVAKYSGGIGAFTSATSVFSIHDPNVNPSTTFQDHSLSQIWVRSGDGFNGDNGDGVTCSCSGAGCTQSVEVGWDVDQFWNNFFNVPVGSSTVFIFSTNDGYHSGCYDGMTVGTGACLPWVQLPGASLTPGKATNFPSGQPGQTQHEVQFIVGSGAQGWFIYSNVDGGTTTGMGYYPGSNYFGAMQYQATKFQVGGEVFDKTSTWVTPMGTGETPNGGFGHGAYHRGYYVCTNSTCDGTFNLTGSTRPSDYAVTTAPAGPHGATTNYFYFGNAAHVFWGGDYGSQWWPNGQDWLRGSFKGQCGLVGNNGQPLVGLSKYTGGSNQAHAVECWNQGFGTVTNTGGCYARQFGPGDNRGYTGDGDWDPRFNKGECRQGEYVLGVAQTQSGQIDGILCCPANLSGASCAPEIFYSGNSTHYAAPDWDNGYYKGQCPPGAYVQGVSSVWSSSDGVPEAPHALLCCH